MRWKGSWWGPCRPVWSVQSGVVQWWRLCHTGEVAQSRAGGGQDLLGVQCCEGLQKPEDGVKAVAGLCSRHRCCMGQ